MPYGEVNDNAELHALVKSPQVYLSLQMCTKCALKLRFCDIESPKSNIMLNCIAYPYQSTRLVYF